MLLPNLTYKPQSTGKKKKKKKKKGEEKEKDNYGHFTYPEVIYLASLTIYTLAKNKGGNKNTSENLDI